MTDSQAQPPTPDETSQQAAQQTSSADPAPPDAAPAGDLSPKPETKRGGPWVAIVVCLLAAGVLALFYTRPDAAGNILQTLEGWAAEFSRPPLVAAEGKASLNGEPIPEGLIQTVPLDGQPAGAIGIIEPDGRFFLRTQVGDGYQKGAYTGRHKVAVKYGTSAPRQLGVTPLVPEEFFDISKTPLTIIVSEAPEQNSFDIQVTGEPPEEPSRGGPPGDGGDGQRRGGGGPPQIPGRPNFGPPDAEQPTADDATEPEQDKTSDSEQPAPDKTSDNSNPPRQEND